MNIIDFVDYKLRRFEEDFISSDVDVVQVTLRIPLEVRNRADVVSDFLHITRNSLFVAILEDGVKVAFDRLKDNPVLSEMRINDLTFDQAYEALSSGQISSVKGGLSLEQTQEFLNSEAGQQLLSEVVK